MNGTTAIDIARPLTDQSESHAFHKLRWRSTASVLRQTMQQSRLRVTLVVSLSSIFWFGLFFLFTEGFQFLNTSIGDPVMHARTVQAIYNVFFASLMMMLTLSSGIISYSGLYRSPEAAFLLTIPARPERIVLHKFQEALVFSSWGFLLLGTPMLIAYGAAADAPWYYFALLAPFMLAFIYIPGAIGLICCLLLVDRMPRIRIHTAALVGLIVVVVLLGVWWSLFWQSNDDLLTPSWFRNLLGRLSFSEHRLLPSWWLSSGLLEAAQSDGSLENQRWSESLKFLALLISYALFCHVLIVWIAGRVYRKSYTRLHAEGSPKRSTHGWWLDHWITDQLPLLPKPLRLLIVKDLRVFRRDPVQWSQFLIFFGLLALYFANIRRFNYDGSYIGWVNMISFLNLAVVGLILSTFTTRFIFPMISLEGRRFWILGLLPVTRRSILWGKFLFAAIGSSIPCTLLILLSDLMLRISPLILVIHQVICLILCVGLSGIAVGLGAKMPNLRESSPSKIAAGFGGTLNLVLSAMYILAVVLMTAVPCHFYLAAQHQGINSDWINMWLTVGTVSTIAVGMAATFIPMHIGLKAFQELEF